MHSGFKTHLPYPIPFIFFYFFFYFGGIGGEGAIELELFGYICYAL